MGLVPLQRNVPDVMRGAAGLSSNSIVHQSAAAIFFYQQFGYALSCLLPGVLSSIFTPMMVDEQAELDALTAAKKGVWDASEDARVEAEHKRWLQATLESDCWGAVARDVILEVATHAHAVETARARHETASRSVSPSAGLTRSGKGNQVWVPITHAMKRDMQDGKKINLPREHCLSLRRAGTSALDMPANCEALLAGRKGIEAKRDAREIPSLSVALMEQAPQVVGTDLWQQCIDRQREEAVRQAAAAAGHQYTQQQQPQQPAFNQHDADQRRMARRATLEADIFRSTRAPSVDVGNDVLEDGDLFNEDQVEPKARKPKKSPPSDFKRWAECNVLDAATCRAKLEKAAAKRGITVDPNDSACELLSRAAELFVKDAVEATMPICGASAANVVLPRWTMPNNQSETSPACSAARP